MLGELSSVLMPQLSSTRRKQHYRGQEPRQRTPSRDAFAANQAILTLNLLAYNLLHLGGQADERAEARPEQPLSVCVEGTKYKKHSRKKPRMPPLEEHHFIGKEIPPFFHLLPYSKRNLT